MSLTCLQQVVRVVLVKFGEQHDKRTNRQTHTHLLCGSINQEGLAVASIARDDPSTLNGDDPFPRARMHRDRNAR